MTMISTPARAVVWLSADGWRWKVQSSNWRTIDVALHGVKRRQTAVETVKRRYPGIEVMIGD